MFPPFLTSPFQGLVCVHPLCLLSAEFSTFSLSLLHLSSSPPPSLSSPFPLHPPLSHLPPLPSVSSCMPAFLGKSFSVPLLQRCCPTLLCESVGQWGQEDSFQVRPDDQGGAFQSNGLQTSGERCPCIGITSGGRGGDDTNCRFLGPNPEPLFSRVTQNLVLCILEQLS